MKIYTAHSSRRPGRFAVGLLALFFLAAGAVARPPESHPPGRFLFVFETTPALQKTLPALEKYLVTIFAGSLRGELHAGDEIGVWTLDEQVHTGQFPLTLWSPTNAAAFDRDLKGFLEKQSFQKPGSLAPLTTLLNGVIENSERLTVLIFCDGQTGIKETPFDEGVRAVLDATAARQKKARQPVVVVLRSQLGKYTGSAVTLPPNPLNLPQFPPLPAPPAPVAAPVVVVPPPVARPAPVVVPSLIMVGTNLSPSAAPGKIATEKPVAKAAPAPVPLVLEKPVVPPTPVPAPLVLEKPAAQPTPVQEKSIPASNSVEVAVKTNPVAPPAVAVFTQTNLTNLAVTVPVPAVVKTVPQKITPPAPPAPTNLALAPAAPAEPAPTFLLFIASGGIGLAVVLVVLLVVRSRRPTGSLITSSMTQPKPPPKPK